jgi:hypothetical protein
MAVVGAFQASQDAEDLSGCLALIADDAVVDVGRGHYEGKEGVRSWLGSTIFPIHTRTDKLEALSVEEDRASTLLTLSDDNTRRLHLAPVQVQAEFVVHQGKIVSLAARPTAGSLATVRAIQEVLAKERQSKT